MAKRQIDLNEVNEMLKAGAPFASAAEATCWSVNEVSDYVKGLGVERKPRRLFRVITVFGFRTAALLNVRQPSTAYRWNAVPTRSHGVI